MKVQNQIMDKSYFFTFLKIFLWTNLAKNPSKMKFLLSFAELSACRYNTGGSALF